MSCLAAGSPARPAAVLPQPTTLKCLKTRLIRRHEYQRGGAADGWSRQLLDMEVNNGAEAGLGEFADLFKGASGTIRSSVRGKL